MIGILLVAAVLIVVLRRNSPEQAFALTVACLCVVGIALLEQTSQLLERISAFSYLPNGEFLQAAVKAVGLSILTQTASDTCSDFGQSALAGKIELAGKLAILAVAMPLFDTLLEMIQRMLE